MFSLWSETSSDKQGQLEPQLGMRMSVDGVRGPHFIDTVVSTSEF